MKTSSCTSHTTPVLRDSTVAILLGHIHPYPPSATARLVAHKSISTAFIRPPSAALKKKEELSFQYLKFCLVTRGKNNNFIAFSAQLQRDLRVLASHRPYRSVLPVHCHQHQRHCRCRCHQRCIWRHNLPVLRHILVILCTYPSHSKNHHIDVCFSHKKKK